MESSTCHANATLTDEGASERDVETSKQAIPDYAKGVNKDHIDMLRSKTVVLQLELTLLKAQRATDRGKIEQLERDLEIMRESSRELVDRLGCMGQLLARLEKLSKIMTTYDSRGATPQRSRSTRMVAVGSLRLRIPESLRSALLAWLRHFLSLALCDWALPQADIFTWVAFGLHQLCMFLLRVAAPAPAISNEYPLWAALDM